MTQRDWLVCGPVSDRVMAQVLRKRKIYEILRDVAQETGVGVRDIRSTSRYPHHVSARWEVMARARRAGWSYPYIGRQLKRDHSTIMHACKKMGVA